MKIDCNTCSVRGAACRDCVVTFLTIEVRPSVIDVNDEQAAAIGALSQAGLVPPLRLVPGQRHAS